MRHRYDLYIFINKHLLCSELPGYLGCCRLLMLLVLVKRKCQNYYYKEAQRETYIVDIFSFFSSRKYQVQNKNYRIIEGYIYIFIYCFLFNTLTLRVMFLESLTEKYLVFTLRRVAFFGIFNRSYFCSIHLFFV